MKAQISIVVTRYSESDRIVRACLRALMAQTVPCEVWFLDQRFSEEIKTLCEECSHTKIKFNYLQIEARSLSYARNQGIKLANASIIGFLDADALACSSWAEEVLKTFELMGADIVGTKIIPKWTGKTSWYHNSKYIREFYSLLDLGIRRMPISKVVGASFIINTARFQQEMYFDENSGRREGRLFGGEETDLCRRVRAAGGEVFYTPFAYVEHIVGVDRTRFRWLARRAYYGGLSRAQSGGAIQTFNSQRHLLDYFALFLILPSYLAGYIRGKAGHA